MRTAPADDAVVTVTLASPNSRSSGPRYVSTVCGLMSHRCTRYRHSGTTMTNTAIPTTVTAAAVTCAQASLSSTTANHTTWPTASTSHGIAAPIAHTSGALRLGRLAGSTRSISGPFQVQAFGGA